MSSMIDWTVKNGEQGEHSKYTVTESYIDNVEMPEESFGLCDTTRTIKTKVKVEVPIYTSKGKVSKTRRKKYKTVVEKTEISHIDEPEVLANGYCIGCWDKNQGGDLPYHLKKYGYKNIEDSKE